MNVRISNPIRGGLAAAVILAAGALPALAADYRMDIQTAVPNASLYYKLTEQFAEDVETMSGGRIKVNVLPDGAEVAAFEILDAVSDGVVTAGYAWPHYWSGKHSAYVLFSNVPASTGMDQESLMSWYHAGEGRDLYRELMQDVMGYDVEPFLMQPMGPDPLGWFSRPFESLDEFKSIKYRTPPGIAGETYSNMGVPAVALPGSEIVPAAQRGTIDAAEWIGPADDRNLGLNNIWDYYYLQGLHQQTDIGELLINKTWFEGLPADLQAIIQVAVKANATSTNAMNLRENALAVKEYEESGINVLDVPDEYYTRFIDSQNEVIKKYLAADDFFARVYKSQEAFADLVYPYHARVVTLHRNVVEGAEAARNK